MKYSAQNKQNKRTLVQYTRFVCEKNPKNCSYKQFLEQYLLRHLGKYVLIRYFLNLMQSQHGQLTELNKLLEEVLGEKKCPQKHGGSDAISMTANTLSSWYLQLTNRDPKLLRMSFTPLVFAQNIVFLYVVCAVC